MFAEPCLIFFNGTHIIYDKIDNGQDSGEVKYKKREKQRSVCVLTIFLYIFVKLNILWIRIP